MGLVRERGGRIREGGLQERGIFLVGVHKRGGLLRGGIRLIRLLREGAFQRGRLIKNLLRVLMRSLYFLRGRISGACLRGGPIREAGLLLTKVQILLVVLHSRKETAMWTCGKMLAMNWKSFRKLNGFVLSSSVLDFYKVIQTNSLVAR